MNLFQLPQVDPMMVRRFSFNKGEVRAAIWRDKIVCNDLVDFDCEELGMAESRLYFDDDVIDQSNRIFEFTNMIILGELGKEPRRWAIFTSRRWRTCRKDDECEYPNGVLEFIGNPIIIDAVRNEANLPPDGLSPIVYREKSYLIKSGAALLNEQM